MEEFLPKRIEILLKMVLAVSQKAMFFVDVLRPIKDFHFEKHNSFAKAPGRSRAAQGGPLRPWRPREARIVSERATVNLLGPGIIKKAMFKGPRLIQKAIFKSPMLVDKNFFQGPGPVQRMAEEWCCMPTERAWGSPAGFFMGPGKT